MGSRILDYGSRMFIIRLLQADRASLLALLRAYDAGAQAMSPGVDATCGEEEVTPLDVRETRAKGSD